MNEYVLAKLNEMREEELKELRDLLDSMLAEKGETVLATPIFNDEQLYSYQHLQGLTFESGTELKDLRPGVPVPAVDMCGSGLSYKHPVYLVVAIHVSSLPTGGKLILKGSVTTDKVLWPKVYVKLYNGEPSILCEADEYESEDIVEVFREKPEGEFMEGYYPTWGFDDGELVTSLRYIKECTL